MDLACFISCHYQKHLNVVIFMSNAMASDASLLRFFLSSHVTCKKGELDGRAIFTPVLRAIDMQPQSIFSATGAQKKSRSMVMKTSCSGPDCSWASYPISAPQKHLPQKEKDKADQLLALGT